MPRHTRPDHIERGDPIRASYLRTLAEAIVQRISVVGGRVKRVGTSIVIDVDRQRFFGQGRRFRITAQTLLATNRWRYSGTEVRYTKNGDFVDATDGLTVTNMFNTIETPNDSAGKQGNGVDIDGTDYPAGFAPIPLGLGAVVKAEPVATDDPEVAYDWLFEDTHLDDGTCS